MKGIDRNRTIFKYTSSSSNSITFDRSGIGGDTSFLQVGDLTLDRNGSAGRGLHIGNQYSMGGNFVVGNLGGTAYAMVMDRCALTGAYDIDV